MCLVFGPGGYVYPPSGIQDDGHTRLVIFQSFRAGSKTHRMRIGSTTHPEPVVTDAGVQEVAGGRVEVDLVGDQYPVAEAASVPGLVVPVGVRCPR